MKCDAMVVALSRILRNATNSLTICSKFIGGVTFILGQNKSSGGRWLMRPCRLEDRHYLMPVGTLYA